MSSDCYILQEVCKEYRFDGGRRVPVLNELELQVESGQWLALTGHSGCGKSTLLHLLGALDKPDSGRVYCLGRSLASLSAKAKAELRRRTIGFMFQSYHLLPELNALENIMLPAIGEVKWKENRNRSRELLKQFGLSEREGHRPQELSGGEQQRVALARALINQPQILLADEPTGNLDREAASTIMELLKDLHRSAGTTIIMVTHDRNIAEQADKVYLMRDGAVCQPQE